MAFDQLKYINDFNNINQIIFEQTGEYSKIFRFPGGSSNTISKFNKGFSEKYGIIICIML